MANHRRLKVRAQNNAEKLLAFTIQGEWFPGNGNPEGYDPAADPWHKGDESVLETELRLFGAATRFSFDRLLEGDDRENLKLALQKLLSLNSRYSDDAILKAQEIITSQKALIPLEIEETKVKLERAQRKVKANRKKERKLRERGAFEYAERVALAIRGQEAREQKLADKLAKYEAHQKNDTIPKIVFGGRKLWEELTQGRASREEWRDARRCRLYSRGDETKGGNPNLKLGYDGGEFQLKVTLSHLSVKMGHSLYIRQGKRMERDTMSRGPRIGGRLWVPAEYRSLLWDHLLEGQPYAVELIRGKDGRYRVHIALPLERPQVRPNLSRGVLGFDTNPDGIAVYNLDVAGNREPFPAGFDLPYPTNLGKFAGEFSLGVGNGVLWLHLPELTYAQGFRRNYLIGVMAKVLVDTAQILHKPPACEGLEFKKKHDTNRVFNRMSSNFSYAKILEAVSRRCRKEGIALIPVDPAYTSCMGFWKYARREESPSTSRHPRSSADGPCNFRNGLTHSLDNGWRYCGRSWSRRRKRPNGKDAYRWKERAASGLPWRRSGLSAAMGITLQWGVIRGGGEAGLPLGGHWWSLGGTGGEERQLAGSAETPVGVLTDRGGLA